MATICAADLETVCLLITVVKNTRFPIIITASSRSFDQRIPFEKGVMVRLMLVLAPVMCILSGIAVSSSLNTYMKYLDPPAAKPASKGGKGKHDPAANPRKEGIAYIFIGLLTFFLMSYTFHCTWVTSEAYSSPSIVLSARSHDGSRIIFDDFREAYWWLRMNTAEDAKVSL